MREVVFHDHVLALVDELVARHAPERGGILLGPIGLPVVSQFIFDANAIATGVTFTPSQQVDAEVRSALTSDLEVKGILHSHPGGMDHPSPGDEASFERWLRRMPWLGGLITPIVTASSRGGGAAAHKIGVSGGEVSVFVAERRETGLELIRPTVRILPVAAVLETVAAAFGLQHEHVEPTYVSVVGHPHASATVQDEGGASVTVLLPYTYPLHPPLILAPTRSSGPGEPAADTHALALEWDLNADDGDRLERALNLAIDGRPSAVTDEPTPIRPSSPEEAADGVRAGLKARLDGAVAPSVGNSTVLVVGLGSGGSQTVEALARSSVERFIVIDPDEVEAANLSRSAYDASDIGRSKCAAIGDRVRAINPGASVVGHVKKLDELSPDELAELVSDADVVIAATDDPDAQYRINHVAWEGQRPAVFAGVYERGAAGEVIFSIPEITACFRCATAGRRGGRRGTAVLNYGTGQLVAEPALGPDITHVVSSSVKLTIGLLELSDPAAHQNSAASLVARAAASGQNFLQMSMVADYDYFSKLFATVPGQLAYQSVWLETRSDPSCRTCGEQREGDRVAGSVDVTILRPVEAIAEDEAECADAMADLLEVPADVVPASRLTTPGTELTGSRPEGGGIA